jgi:hypothetical protein
MENKKFKFLFVFGIFIVTGVYISYLFIRSSKLFDEGIIGNAYIYTKSIRQA